MEINQMNVFSLPIFQVELPELAAHNDDMVKLFEEEIASGKLRANVNGFGYQTPFNLLDPDAYSQTWFREILAPAFGSACLKILKQANVDWAPDTKFHWVNTMTLAWAVVQTDETFADNPWHTHHPATLSGCYYARTSKNPKEGNFQFQNPATPNLFQPRQGTIVPKEGTMLIFPSFLNHRPTMCPSMQDGIRLSLCLDGHFTAQFENK